MTAEEYLEKVGIPNGNYEQSLTKFATEFSIEQLKSAKEASCILSRNDLVEWFDKKISELKSEL